MVIAVLETTLPRADEAVTIRALRAFWDTNVRSPSSSCSHSWTRRPSARRCGSTSSPRPAGCGGWSSSDWEPRASEATVSNGR